MPVRRVQGTVPDTVPRHAGGYPAPARGRVQEAARAHALGRGAAARKAPVRGTDGAGPAGERVLHLLPGRAVRAARGRAETHRGQALVPHPY